MEAPEDFQEGRPLPNKFRRLLDALVVSYPGYESDLAVARNAIEAGSKKEFLRVFHKLKGRQIAYEHYQETKDSAKWISNELEYPGNEADKRKLQTFFRENPPTVENIKIFKEQIEGLRNKNAAVRGDRSHPNIAALLKLKLSYPGCEEDVQEALQVHYSRPLTQFPNKIHSLETKQSAYMDDRSHWRLVQLDDLELSYPRWKRDIEAAEDWHAHNAENRENDVLFHDIIEGMLEKQALYLEWVHQRRKSESEMTEKRAKKTDLDDILGAIDEYEGRVASSIDGSSFDKYYVVEREDDEKRVSTTRRALGLVDEEREPVLGCERA